MYAPHAALPEHEGALEPRRAGADDQHLAAGVRRTLETLRVPAAAELLARGRILRARDLVMVERARKADVATDALADLVEPSLLDLLRQERVGDRRPRGADQIPDAAADDLHHSLRARQASDAYDRLRRGLTNVARPLELPALIVAARRRDVRGAVGDRADVHVPEVDEVIGQPNELESLLELDSVGPSGVDGEPGGDRAVVADGLAHELERLEPEARPVRQRPAVLVRALVVERGEELQRQEAVRAVHVDDVEPGVTGAARRRRVETLELPDAGAVELARVAQLVQVGRDLTRSAGDLATRRALGRGAAVPQLDARERAVPVRLFAHEREIARVVVVPQSRHRPGGAVRLRMDRAELGADRCPAALGLRRAKPCLRAGPVGAEARAVRYLVEAVAQDLRPDSNRLEENVEPRVAGHGRG